MFKIGDLLKIVECNNGHHFKQGTIVKVVCIDGTSYEVEDTMNERRTFWVDKTEVVHLADYNFKEQLKTVKFWS